MDDFENPTVKKLRGSTTVPPKVGKWRLESKMANLSKPATCRLLLEGLDQAHNVRSFAEAFQILGTITIPQAEAVLGICRQIMRHSIAELVLTPYKPWDMAENEKGGWQWRKEEGDAYL
jgi:hypothetical protein